MDMLDQNVRLINVMEWQLTMSQCVLVMDHVLELIIVRVQLGGQDKTVKYLIALERLRQTQQFVHLAVLVFQRTHVPVFLNIQVQIALLQFALMLALPVHKYAMVTVLATILMLVTVRTLGMVQTVQQLFVMVSILPIILSATELVSVFLQIHVFPTNALAFQVITALFVDLTGYVLDPIFASAEPTIGVTGANIGLVM